MDYLTWTLFTACILLSVLLIIVNGRYRRGRKEKDYLEEIARLSEERGDRLWADKRKLLDESLAYRQTQAADRESLAHKAKILEEKNLQIAEEKKENIRLCGVIGSLHGDIELLKRALMKEAPHTRTFINDDEKCKAYLRKIGSIMPRRRPYLSDKQAIEIGKKAKRLALPRDPAEVFEKADRMRAAMSAARGLSSMVPGKETKEGAV